MIEIVPDKVRTIQSQAGPPKVFRAVQRVSGLPTNTTTLFVQYTASGDRAARFFYFTIPSKIQESSYQGGLLGNSQKKHFLTGRKPALKAGTQINLLQLIGGTE